MYKSTRYTVLNSTSTARETIFRLEVVKALHKQRCRDSCIHGRKLLIYGKWLGRHKTKQGTGKYIKIRRTLICFAGMTNEICLNSSSTGLNNLNMRTWKI